MNTDVPTYDKSFREWIAYCRGCTDSQVRNVMLDEHDRATRTGDPDVRLDSLAAVAAARVVEAERRCG